MRQKSDIFTELAMRLMVSFTPRSFDEAGESGSPEEVDQRFEANQEVRRSCARAALAAASAFMQEYGEVADLLCEVDNNKCSTTLPSAGGDSSTDTGGE